MTIHCIPIPKDQIRLQQLGMAITYDGKVILNSSVYCWEHNDYCYDPKRNRRL